MRTNANECFLFLQMLTSVLKEHTTVMSMLCVTTPGDPITARAKMDFMKMEKHAKVTIQIRRIKISCIDVKRYFVG